MESGVQPMEPRVTQDDRTTTSKGATRWTRRFRLPGVSLLVVLGWALVF